MKLIEGENDETPEQREERLQKEKEELINLRFYKVAQQLVINPRTVLIIHITLNRFTVSYVKIMKFCIVMVN